jgi:thiol-disulfide isomerase/thioredoxin
MPRLAKDLTTALLVGIVLPAAGCSTTTQALPATESDSPQAKKGSELPAAKDMAAAQQGGDAETGGGSPAEEQQGDQAATDEAPTKPAAMAAAPKTQSEPKAEKATIKEGAAKPKKKTAATAVALELPKPIHTKIVETCGNDPGVGQRLKSFKLKTPDGEPISPGKYRGRVLLVNFWGTWCEPCLKEMPKLEALYRRYRKHGLTLIAIATDEEAEPVKETVRKKRMRAKVAIGGESYAESFNAGTFPFSFVVDAKGVIRGSYRGYKPQCMGKLEADVRRELEKRSR